MALTTPKMSLRVWDQLSDPYDHAQLADNWSKVDFHDHTPGRGVPIPTEGIADDAITAAKLSPAVRNTSLYGALVDRPAANTVAYGSTYTDEHGTVWRSDGVGAWSILGGNLPHVHLTMMNAFAFNASTWTNVVWDTEWADLWGMHGTDHIITLPYGGIWNIAATGNLYNNTVGNGSRIMQIVSSGSTIYGTPGIGSLGTSQVAANAVDAATRLHLSMTRRFEAGDTFYVRVWHNCSTSPMYVSGLQTAGPTGDSSFTASMVSP